jgi:hypothetical protein
MQHTGFAFLHMELNVESPVFAGDTIHAECEVVEARAQPKPPGPRPRAHPHPGRQTGRRCGTDLHAASHAQMPGEWGLTSAMGHERRVGFLLKASEPDDIERVVQNCLIISPKSLEAE